MVTRLAAELPGRQVHVTADSAYAGEEVKELPDGVTWTTRLRSDAAPHGLPPERARERIPAPAKRCTQPARSTGRMSPARPGLRVTRSLAAPLSPGPRGPPIWTADSLPQARSSLPRLCAAGTNAGEGVQVDLADVPQQRRSARA
jgi:hypothetical protein